MCWFYFRIGDYKLIVGSPGIYNQWFTMPKTKSFCNSGEVAEDIFLYDNLNNAVRNIKSYISWFGSTLPGYSYWRHYKRLHALQKCKQKAKKERQKWVFPKFLLYNIKGMKIVKSILIIDWLYRYKLKLQRYTHRKPECRHHLIFNIQWNILIQYVKKYSHSIFNILYTIKYSHTICNILYTMKYSIYNEIFYIQYVIVYIQYYIQHTIYSTYNVIFCIQGDILHTL